MHLKTLTVRGFKSFASATTFVFEPGVTAVVGPNGSGKSNVVDALAWVMGEQGAKSLRGGSMEDVIFAGTAERQPLGRASVSLTIDNSDGALPIDYSEVSISRTMFRSGGSEYTINGSKCRLLDIQELLSDSGLGREMHVIVGQGQLDQILHATPEQRRGFIEEAAGVLKHRRRRERTVRKLESMQTNLERLEDLITEISRQLAPLGRQATVARRAQRIQYDVRDALSRLIADDLVQAATALHQSSQSETQDAELANSLKEHLASQDEHIRQLAHQADQLRQRTDTFNSGHHRLAQIQERLRSVGSLAAERSNSLAAAAAVDVTRDRDPQKLYDQARDIGYEAAEQQKHADAAGEALAEATRLREVAEQALKTEETRLTEQMRAVADRRAGLATLQGRVETARGRCDAAESRQRRAREQYAQEHAELEKSQAELAELEQHIAGMETGESGLEQACQRTQHYRDQLSSEHEQLITEQRRLEIELSEHRARLSGLEAARSPRDGAAVLLDHQQWVSGTYAEKLHVKRGWERAIAAALGSLDSALAATDSASAAAAVQWLGEHGAGRVHLVYPQSAAASTHSAELPSGAHWARDLVTAGADWAAPLNTALKGTVVTRGLTTAQELMTRADVVTAITADGIILREGEQIGGTAVENADIALNAQMEELREQIKTADKSLEGLNSQVEVSQGKLAAAELQVNEALDARQSSESALASAEQQLSRLRAEISRAQNRVSALDREITEAQSAAEDADHQLRDITARLETADQPGDIEEPSTAERDRLSECASAERRKEVDSRLGLRAAEEQHQQLLERAAGLRRSAQAEEHRREQARAAALRRSERSQQAAALSTEAEAWVETLTLRLDHIGIARSQAQDSYRDITARIHQLRGARTEQASELEDVTQRLHQAEVRRTELRLSLESAEARAAEELSLTPEYLIEHYGPDQPVPLPEQDDSDSSAESPSIPYLRTEQQNRLQKAKRDLQALGKVNPLALEEHAALEERHTYLQNQLADLKKSRQDLLDIIADVDDTVLRVFTQAWHDTEIQFQRVFSRLFPGGEGRLELTSPEDMLNTGIEVHARPPGKRIRRLSLLSGGERSLTAVALLVAIFKARPSPFYVMDEVEAALDDTNLSRLLVIFEELRENSQLIVITHQKRTMEIADALYGVSMRQDGSTRVVSQRLSTAAQH